MYARNTNEDGDGKMRDIIFRGKTESGEWIYGDLIHNGVEYNGFLIRYITEEVVSKKHRIIRTEKVLVDTVGQYTGLTDKNGVKIFEGDMVQIKENCPQLDGVVRFGTGAFDSGYYEYSGWYVEILADGDVDHTSLVELVQDSEFKVIGNIHNNPELIKVVTET